MASLLKRWWGREAAAPLQPGRFRPRSDYRADLIPALHAEHQELLALLGALERASKFPDEVACRTALDRFVLALQQHLAAEQRHLFGYFSRHPDPNPKVAERIEIIATEMLQIGKTLQRFIATYSHGQWNAKLREKLRLDLPAVGSMLNHRIHEEEAELYPLYQGRTS